VVAPDDHPLAKLDRVSLAELGDYELLLEPQGTSFRDELDREAAAVGVTLRPQAEVDGLRLVASLTFEGFGAAVLPATAVPTWLAGAWRRVPVDGLAPRQVGLAHRRRARLSAPARAVRDTLLAVVANAQQPGVHPHLS
jgi:DNA-binding transcriptional LysR family regulator